MRRTAIPSPTPFLPCLRLAIVSAPSLRTSELPDYVLALSGNEVAENLGEDRPAAARVGLIEA
jgi:hypothetical protein